MASYVAAKIYNHNIIIINTYQIIESLLILLFLLYRNKNKWLIGVLIALWLLFALLVVSSGIHEFHGYLLGIKALFFDMAMVLFLINFVLSQEMLFTDESPIFWFSIGFIFYFSGGLFSFLVSSDILSKPDGLASWIFHNISNVLKNILFAIGLWKARALS